jgi:hypothetical protein
MSTFGFCDLESYTEKGHRQLKKKYSEIMIKDGHLSTVNLCIYLIILYIAHIEI